MTRVLADTIARAIADQIESSRSIIVQNMADVIHDALLLDAAKQEPAIEAEELRRPEPRRGSRKNWWMTEPGPEAGE